MKNTARRDGAPEGGRGAGRTDPRKGRRHRVPSDKRTNEKQNFLLPIRRAPYHEKHRPPRRRARGGAGDGAYRPPQEVMKQSFERHEDLCIADVIKKHC